MNFGYLTTFQSLDKGLIERLGPTGFTVSTFSLSFNSGKIILIAVAEPVVVGISEFKAERARRVSIAGLSAITWVFVTLCSVVIDPCSMPISS